MTGSDLTGPDLTGSDLTGSGPTGSGPTGSGPTGSGPTGSGPTGPRLAGPTDRIARAAWSRLAEPGDHEAVRWVAERGPVEALRALAAGGGRPRWRVRLEGTDPRRDLSTLYRFGGRLLVPGDPEWPAAMADLAEGEPFCLWVRGALDLAKAVGRSVAVVGARAATPYGEQVASSLAAGCADQGVTVVSGAAFGIDAAAHRGALAAGGATVAVLACGVDRAYPQANAGLIARVIREGAVVSEVPPGSAPTRWRFIERNRLIAALATATVVVEAGVRSGALGTAHRAVSIGREVAVVPGPVTSPLSRGTHALLRDGATCVTNADEVLELVGSIGEAMTFGAGGSASAEAGALSGPAEGSSPERRELDGLDAYDLRVAEALPLRSAATLGSVARTAGLPEGGVAAALGRLEMRGVAERDGGRWRRVPRRRSGLHTEEPPDA